MADGACFNRPDLAEMHFAEAMRMFAASVCVISAENEGMRAAVAASSVATLSIAPRGILVSVDDRAPALKSLTRSGKFCINILGAEHADVEGICAALNDPICSYDGDWRGGPFEIPYLYGAQASLFCYVMGHAFVGVNGLIVGHAFHALSAETTAPLIRFAGAHWPMVAS